MSNQPKSSSKPTHRVYAVSKRGEKSHWQEIGAAWGHRDGKGMNLKLDYLPLNGAELVLRIPDAIEAATSKGVSLIAAITRSRAATSAARVTSSCQARTTTL